MEFNSDTTRESGITICDPLSTIIPSSSSRTKDLYIFNKFCQRCFRAFRISCIESAQFVIV